MPCDHDDAPQFLTDTAACCAVAPSQSQPVMSRIQKDDSTESPSSYYSPDIASFPLARPTYQSQAPPHSLRIEPHTLGRQQQLYLHTGRLRI